MKILDIIESRAGIAARLLGKFGSRAELVDKLAADMAARGKFAGPATNQEAYSLAKEYGPRARELVKNDSTILSDAVKQANKARDPSALAKLTGKTAPKATAVRLKISGWKSIGKAGLLAIQGYGLYEGFVVPWNDFTAHMEAAEAKVEAKEWTEENYNYSLNQELSILVGKWATQIMLGTFAKWLVINRAGKLVGYLGGKLGEDFTKAIGTTAFRTWLSNKDNAEYIASIMLTEIWGVKVDQVLGGLLAPYYKKFHSLTGLGPTMPGDDGAGQGGHPSTAGQDIGNTSDTTSPGDKDNGSGPGLATLNNLQQYVPVPGNSNLIYNPKAPQPEQTTILKPPGWKK
jgi:hypothetical protein